MPISDDRVSRLYQNISDTIIANVYGILTVGVVQGILTGIAMKIVGMPSAMLLGLSWLCVDHPGRGLGARVGGLPFRPGRDVEGSLSACLGNSNT